MLFDWYDQEKKVCNEVRRHYLDREYAVFRPANYAGLFRGIAGDKME